MRTSLSIPDDLDEEIQRTADHLKEKPSTILRLAIRAGLPTLGQQAPRPDGYFASAYENNPEERARAEAGAAKMDVGSEERARK